MRFGYQQATFVKIILLKTHIFFHSFLLGSYFLDILSEKLVALYLPNNQNDIFADTMMKFGSVETIVELVYKYAVPTPKEQCSKPFQLGVSFAGGYVAGIFCALVSHPADNLVSFLNNAKGATVADVSKDI